MIRLLYHNPAENSTPAIFIIFSFWIYARVRVIRLRRYSRGLWP